MHELSTSFVLGYHGCDEEVAEELLKNNPFSFEKNAWDWLGWGAYFWEVNPLRAMEYAREISALPRHGAQQIGRPSVVGAVIDLGFCLDLISSTGIKALKPVYDDFLKVCEQASAALPQNIGGADLLQRNLDCAVINHLHHVRDKANLRPFQTVRGVFMEDEAIYPNSGFKAKTHIQICVRDLNCIKGVFRVPETHLDAF